MPFTGAPSAQASGPKESGTELVTGGLEVFSSSTNSVVVVQQRSPTLKVGHIVTLDAFGLRAGPEGWLYLLLSGFDVPYVIVTQRHALTVPLPDTLRVSYMKATLTAGQEG